MTEFKLQRFRQKPQIPKITEQLLPQKLKFFIFWEVLSFTCWKVAFFICLEVAAIGKANAPLITD